MSRSDRAPGGNEAASTPESPHPGVSHPFFVSSHPVPAVVRSDMRTVDPVTRIGAARKEEATSSFLVGRAASIIDELERATREKSFRGRGSRLFFHEAHNEVTGQTGIIVHKALGPGLYTPPLAELLVSTPELNEDARGAADRLGACAARRDLRIFVYEDAEESFPRPAVFAAIKRPDEPGTSRLLARLLVTPFEASQWSDLKFEVGGFSLN